MIKISTKDIVLTAFFMALCILFPVVFHQFALGGRLFLPMHIPVLLAGILVGPLSGFLTSAISPSLSFLLTGMPPAYAVPLMSLELVFLGISMGILKKFTKLPLILSLVLAMIVGRIGFALGLLILGRFIALPYGLSTYFKAAFVTGLPGILLQLILIPLLVKRIEKATKKKY
jgi:riboflavin transporter FmnP